MQVGRSTWVFDPQGLNRYSYVKNRPLSLIDPSGFSSIGTGEAEGGGGTGGFRNHYPSGPILGCGMFCHPINSVGRRVGAPPTEPGSTGAPVTGSPPIVGTPVFNPMPSGSMGTGPINPQACEGQPCESAHPNSDREDLERELGIHRPDVAAARQAGEIVSETGDVVEDAVTTGFWVGLGAKLAKWLMLDRLRKASAAIPNKVFTTLDHVRRTGQAPPGYAGGRVFKNREGRLPASGHYREYDVDPRPPVGASRNNERLVIDEKTGRAWYTNDHYDTFREIGEM